MTTLHNRITRLESALEPPEPPCRTCWGHPVQIICDDGATLPDGVCPDCGTPASGREHRLGVPLASYRRITMPAIRVHGLTLEDLP